LLRLVFRINLGTRLGLVSAAVSGTWSGKSMKTIPAISLWVASFPAEIIVCDVSGRIIEMNDCAIE
jgi:hypothetical protein